MYAARVDEPEPLISEMFGSLQLKSFRRRNNQNNQVGIWRCSPWANLFCALSHQLVDRSGLMDAANQSNPSEQHTAGRESSPKVEASQIHWRLLAGMRRAIFNCFLAHFRRRRHNRHCTDNCTELDMVLCGRRVHVIMSIQSAPHNSRIVVISTHCVRAQSIGRFMLKLNAVNHIVSRTRRAI